MGLFVFLTNVFFFVLQCLVDPKNLLIKAVKQLPVCAFFGAVFDVAMWLTSFMDPTNYGWAFMQVFLGYVSYRARCFGDGLCPFAGVAAGRFCDRCHASLRRIVRHNSHDSRRVSCDSVRHDEFVLFRYGLRCSRRNADFRAFLRDVWPTDFSEDGGGCFRSTVRLIDATKKFCEGRAKTPIFC